jgi:hypothetical protein
MHRTAVALFVLVLGLVLLTGCGGGSATSGRTVALSAINTYWTADGPIQMPANFANNPTLAAFVPQPDGSFRSLQSYGGANGLATIPNVPSGYYWLPYGPYRFWTSSSNVDLGIDLTGPHALVPNTPVNTDFMVTATGLDPLPQSSPLDFIVTSGDIGIPIFYTSSDDPPNTTAWTAQGETNPNIVLSGLSGFMVQYEPESIGSFSAWKTGPGLALTVPNATNGSVTIDGQLSSGAPTSLEINIQGSAWAPLFNRVAPVAVEPTSSFLNIAVQPFVNNHIATWGLGIDLFWANLNPPNGIVLPNCNPTWMGGYSTLSQQLFETSGPILTDEDLGTIEYGDPWPEQWPRVFSFCQQGSFQTPIPNSTATQSFSLVNGLYSPLPDAPVTPLISAVQNPTINGVDLFTATTFTGNAATLSWSAPAIGTPTGYKVDVAMLQTFPEGSPYFADLHSYYTTTTSVTLPEDVMGSNIFMITAFVDGAANVETSPLRSGLPGGWANVVSAVMTFTGSGTPTGILASRADSK